MESIFYPKLTLSFDDDAHILQCGEAYGDVACTVHGKGCHQDDQNDQSPRLSPG